MEYMKKYTLCVVDTVFPKHTQKQKRDSLQFIHGFIVIICLFIFIFSPSKSYIRTTIFVFYLGFMVLYFILGDCWVSSVEKDLVPEHQTGVLDSLLSIIGIPKNKHTRSIIVGISYLYAIFLMSCFMFRDLFGIY
jgi:hypothetical protein